MKFFSTFIALLSIFTGLPVFCDRDTKRCDKCAKKVAESFKNDSLVGKGIHVAPVDIDRYNAIAKEVHGGEFLIDKSLVSGAYIVYTDGTFYSHVTEDIACNKNSHIRSILSKHLRELHQRIPRKLQDSFKYFIFPVYDPRRGFTRDDIVFGMIGEGHMKVLDIYYDPRILCDATGLFHFSSRFPRRNVSTLEANFTNAYHYLYGGWFEVDSVIFIRTDCDSSKWTFSPPMVDIGPAPELDLDELFRSTTPVPKFQDLLKYEIVSKDKWRDIPFHDARHHRYDIQAYTWVKTGEWYSPSDHPDDIARKIVEGFTIGDNRRGVDSLESFNNRDACSDVELQKFLEIYNTEMKADFFSRGQVDPSKTLRVAH
ncbi:uncharacterized protein BXIN_2928 [Babesia sp. Xinjiang]|uniref:uncharacterized protein n=1 Tax=Babesia sp. Xinjiang TaxID=462227 RepID=UPI000A2505DA|nr:uncharacterized protein BXIN_2928 [Babesia sp. Xinjiang]ORM39544.1 hypothetical protein BXIN_2928 [Babesia sp. Xinjiang]